MFINLPVRPAKKPRKRGPWRVVWGPSPHAQRSVIKDNTGHVHLSRFLIREGLRHHVLNTVPRAKLYPWSFGHINPVSNGPLIYVIPVIKIFMCRWTFSHMILIFRKGKLFLLTVGLLVLMTVIFHFKLINLHSDASQISWAAYLSSASQDL